MDILNKLYNEKKKKNAKYLMDIMPYYNKGIWSVGSNYISVRFDSLLIKVEEENFVVVNNDEVNIMKAFEVINVIKLHFRPETKNTILFTGAFNPPTIAHFHMIESALNIYPFDYVIFAISNQKFLDRKQKRLNDWAYSEEARLEMLLRMTSKLENVLIMGIEKTCTYDALNEVKNKYCSENVFFALGSDKLKEIGRWKHHDNLSSEFCFYILKRNDSQEYIEEKCNELFGNTAYVIGTDNIEFKDISATEVRKRIKNNEDFTNLVHPLILPIVKALSL